MLKIVIEPTEMFNEQTQEFFSTKRHELQLEHSLVSVSKWESKWRKPFLSKDAKTKEETMDYIKCMTITQNVDDSVYAFLSRKNIEDINSYIDSPMTATTFSDRKKSSGREIITSEVIYYWMIAQNIPMECQKWHLNRLLTLIRVCNIKNSPPDKIGKSELMRRNSALNAARRAKLGSRG